MSNKAVKFIGIAATVIGMGVGLVTDWVSDKKMDEKIEEGINKALADKEQKEES